MIGYTRAQRPRYQLLGVLFLVLVVLFVTLTIGIYRKWFTPVVLVTLRVDHTGSQLGTGADVKVRGVRVGEVRAITADAAGASLTLALDPHDTALVPQNVSARLLPKTLFGERYVDLVPPDHPTRPIAAGDVIPEDRSRAAIEVEQVLDNLLPVLQAVRPAQVATTLTALDQALHGRGAQLGQTLVGLDDYLKRFNPAVPALVQTLNDLPPVTDTYAQASPDFFGGLADLTTTTQTLADERDDLRRLFLGVGSASDDLAAFLRANEDNLVGVSHSARPALEVLARYAPEYPCLFHQLVAGIPVAEKVFGKGTDHPEQQQLVIQVTANRGKYLPGVDVPRYLDNRGPRCYNQNPIFPQYAPGGPLADGSRKPTPPANLPNPGLLGLDGPPLRGRGSTTGSDQASDHAGDDLLLLPLLGAGADRSASPPGAPTPLEGGPR